MENSSNGFARKVNKPDTVVENEDGLLSEDETITNQEYVSIFFNTAVYDENSGDMLFDSDVINKFQRLLIYQKKLEPLKEKLIFLQFVKYLENNDVEKDESSSKEVTLSLFSEVIMKNVTVYKSKMDGAYVYISILAFRRMLKLLGDNTAQFLKIPDGQDELFISLRLWAFDNNFDVVDSGNRIEIGVSEDSTENIEEKCEDTNENNDMSANSENRRISRKKNKHTAEKNSNALTISEYQSIFNTDIIESGEDIDIKPSIIEKLTKLINNIEAVSPMRAQFAFNSVKKFIDEDVHIENLIEYKVYVNDRIVSDSVKINETEAKHELFTTLDIFKLILMRAGSYYAIYLNDVDNNFNTIYVNLTKWVGEFCGEMNSDATNKIIQITF